MSGHPASQAFKAALFSEVDKLKGKSQREILQQSVDLIQESEVDFDDRSKIGGLLVKVAALGSIEAVALLVASGGSNRQVLNAIRAVAMRSEDVSNGIQFYALVIVFEEWAEGEIAAGRMVKTVCPKTGVFLYQTAEKRS